MVPAAVPDVVLSISFRSLFEAEFGYVCRVLTRLGVHRGDLQDVAQDLFLTVHHQLGDYDPARAVRPWLFSFALRFAANYRRLARHKDHISDEALVEASATDPNVEARTLVLKALDTLDTDRRTVLVMHDLEGFAAPEIAEALGVNLNTVYSRIRLARDGFRSAVTQLQAKGATP